MSFKRLDVFLVETGLVVSRERGKSLIGLDLVKVNGSSTVKPSLLVCETDIIEISDDSAFFVSRGGEKLSKALREFNVDVRGLKAVDIGASTGGFTDCLLRNGALSVTAIDSGINQLSPSLRDDKRVAVLEKTNARFLTADMFPSLFDIAVIDVSFISQMLILPAVSKVLSSDGIIVSLIKPQFEAGVGAANKHGIIKSKSVHSSVLHSFCNYSTASGFFVHGLTYSPIKGAEGNIEFLGLLKREKNNIFHQSIVIKNVVQQAHDSLSKM